MCPYCKEVISYDPPMHEALLSRGKGKGDEYQEFIMSQFNCVFPCVPCHQRMLGVGGDKGFAAAVYHLIEREGFAEVRGWLVVASEKFTAGKEALRRFDALFQLGGTKT